MAYQSYEELEVWKRSCVVAEKVYSLFKTSKEFAIRDQVMRSSVSIPSNIAEGAERNHPAEFRQYLGIAKGSSAELRTQLELSARMGIAPRKDVDELIRELCEISSMLHSLMTKISPTQS
jgi:four helix bundle protein